MSTLAGDSEGLMVPTPMQSGAGQASTAAGFAWIQAVEVVTTLAGERLWVSAPSTIIDLVHLHLS